MEINFEKLNHYELSNACHACQQAMSKEIIAPNEDLINRNLINVQEEQEKINQESKIIETYV